MWAAGRGAEPAPVPPRARAGGGARVVDIRRPRGPAVRGASRVGCRRGPRGGRSAPSRGPASWPGAGGRARAGSERLTAPGAQECRGRSPRSFGSASLGFSQLPGDFLRGHRVAILRSRRSPRSPAVVLEVSVSRAARARRSPSSGSCDAREPAAATEAASGLGVPRLAARGPRARARVSRLAVLGPRPEARGSRLAVLGPRPEARGSRLAARTGGSRSAARTSGRRERPVANGRRRPATVTLRRGTSMTRRTAG